MRSTSVSCGLLFLYTHRLQVRGHQYGKEHLHWTKCSEKKSAIHGEARHSNRLLDTILPGSCLTHLGEKTPTTEINDDEEIRRWMLRTRENSGA